MTFRWADHIQVEDAGEYLKLAGAISLGDRSRGLLTRYGKYLNPVPVPPPLSEDVTEMPHARFAKAADRDGLLRFVKEFGPVVANDLNEPNTTIVVADDANTPQTTTIEVPVITTWVGAVQRWDELRREQKLFRSLLLLIQAVKSGDAEELRGTLSLFDDVLDGTSAWIEQHSRESLQRERNERAPIDWNWSRNQQDILANYFSSVASALAKGNPKLDGLSTLLAHGNPLNNLNGAICEILNAFPPSVQYLPKKQSKNGNNLPRAVEMPRSDLVFGIRPLLYFMLRTDYLRGWELRLCRREGCGEWFRPTGKRPHHCAPECARRHRQSQYWKSKGSNRRRTRIEQEKRPKKAITAKRKSRSNVKA
jgi:hypothetical protein